VLNSGSLGVNEEFSVDSLMKVKEKMMSESISLVKNSILIV
jgi:hypothetical protein